MNTDKSAKLTISVSPKSLMADNRSSKADEGRQEWEEARRKGKLTGVRACGDARMMIPHAGTLRVRTIATGGPEERYTPIFNDPDIDKIAILAHYAGSAVRAGTPPSGCGGLLAKEELLSEVSEEDDLGKFVHHHIASPDVLIQAWFSAATTARRTGKPTLAAVQDHENGRILPVAAFLDGGIEVATAIPIEHMLHGQYHPEKMYEEGIPTLSARKVPSIFDDFLSEGSNQMRQILDDYPNLATMQQIQNPDTIVISTETRPLQICFPDTFKKPGSVFKISVPRTKIDATIPIDKADLKIALAQTLYPIKQCLNNQGNPTGSFTNTNTFFIETEDLVLSKELANTLLENPQVQDWMKLPGRQILVAQMKEGVAHKIEKFEPEN